MKKIDVSVEITKGFDSDEKSLNTQAREQLTVSLNTLVQTARIAFPRKLYKPSGVSFPANFQRSNSSLYVFKATTKLSVILALDTDPLFNQKILTLYRVVSKDIAITAFNQIAQLIYK